jgi:hypothetical protein
MGSLFLCVTAIKYHLKKLISAGEIKTACHKEGYAYAQYLSPQ